MESATMNWESEKNLASSPFLHPGRYAKEASLAILHLKRDHLLPTLLLDVDKESTGYAEGSVTNTRFGSFPHSTLIDQPWGSQVLASKVDTGSRGRKDGNVAAGTKRKIEAIVDTAESSPREPKAAATGSGSAAVAVTASSGFCHILPPTPEAWTISLPHRTQVVYTPDYSYIIQKLGVRPGSVVIEAGAGSGSFTHAAARAVYNGQPERRNSLESPKSGKVYSFEYHHPRVKQLRREIADHGLSSIVQTTHRDVYGDGFLIREPSARDAEAEVGVSPMATHVFLDLPAPWQALPQLSRDLLPSSPLDPTQAVHLCAFLPCIEQVTRTIASLRSHGWLEITMQELMHKRIDVRRERIGLELEGQRGVNSMPATVSEALERLYEVEEAERRYRERGKELERKAKALLAEAATTAATKIPDSDVSLQPNGKSETETTMKVEEGLYEEGDEEDDGDVGSPNDAERAEAEADGDDGDGNDNDDEGREKEKGMERNDTQRQGDERGSNGSNKSNSSNKAARLARLTAQASARQKTVHKEGKLVHRTEPELKTHTSYLVFAISPRPWSAKDEAAARAKWPLKNNILVGGDGLLGGSSSSSGSKKAAGGQYAVHNANKKKKKKHKEK